MTLLHTSTGSQDAQSHHDDLYHVSVHAAEDVTIGVITPLGWASSSANTNVNLHLPAFEVKGDCQKVSRARVIAWANYSELKRGHPFLLATVGNIPKLASIQDLTSL